MVFSNFLNLKLYSRLWVRHIDSWDADSREWIVPMPSAEDVDFLSVGADYVAVFTTSRFLRIFTASGVQRFVTSLSGELKLSQYELLHIYLKIFLF